MCSPLPRADKRGATQEKRALVWEDGKEALVCGVQDLMSVPNMSQCESHNERVYSPPNVVDVILLNSIRVGRIGADRMHR
jgi:hypothetical protein